MELGDKTEYSIHATTKFILKSSAKHLWQTCEPDAYTFNK